MELFNMGAQVIYVRQEYTIDISALSEKNALKVCKQNV